MQKKVDFVDVVRRMREAQKEYFRTRDKRILMRSINLESVVDSLLKDMDNARIMPNRELDLFPDQN